MCRDCCAAAAALHAENVVMRDFRLSNVLTRHGVEGDYVVVDMECAGPDCTEWSLNLLDEWDADTLNEVRASASCYQSGCKPSCMYHSNVDRYHLLLVGNMHLLQSSASVELLSSGPFRLVDNSRLAVGTTGHSQHGLLLIG